MARLAGCRAIVPLVDDFATNSSSIVRVCTVQRRHWQNSSVTWRWHDNRQNSREKNWRNAPNSCRASHRRTLSTVTAAFVI